jgi:hypothetical protein
MRKAILRLITLSLLIPLLSGCVTRVFNEPVTLSTSSEAVKNAKLLQNVSVEYTNWMFVIIPIVSDPRDSYDKLLAKAQANGGNAVVDVQVRSKSFFIWMFPGILKDTWEVTGTAAIIE